MQRAIMSFFGFWACFGSAFGVVYSINFDELTNGTLLTNQYASQGVYFENAVVQSHHYAVSPPNWIHPIFNGSDWDIIRISFPSGASFVSIQGDADGAIGRQNQMRVYDVSGQILKIVNLYGALDIAEYSSATGVIGSIELGAVQNGTTEFVGADGWDNLQFDVSDINAGLVAYYPFDGNAYDASGNGLHGIPTSSVVFTADDRYGRPNKAILINNNNSYIRIPRNTSLDLQNHTISAWCIYQDNIPTTMAGGGIFTNGIINDHYSLVAWNEFIRSFINYPGSIHNAHKYDTNILQDNQFHHLVVTYDSSKRTIWIDGQQKSSMNFSETINYSSREDCYIGMNFPGGHDWFPGVIDELRIYNRALNETEIQQLFINELPSIESVTAHQRTDGSGIVDIHYLISDSDGSNFTIYIEVSSDGGVNWDIMPSPAALKGDIGENITPGSKHIEWDSKMDLPGVFGTNYQVRIIAE